MTVPADEGIRVPPDVPFDLAVTDRLLTTTRAVRRRLDLQRPVEPEVLIDCIRVAQQAPAGNNAPRWRFVVVTDARRRAELAELYRATSEAALRASYEAAADERQRRVYASALHLVDVLHEVPVHVVPCVRGRLPTAASLAEAAGWWASVVPAVWSFMLALRSRGLGSVWTTTVLAREGDLTALLELPDGVVPTALVPVAYYTGTDFRPAHRPPVESMVGWETWGGRPGGGSS